MTAGFIFYLVLGGAWSFWLEYFTINQLEHPWNQPWSNLERAFHITLWPYSLGVFLYAFLKDFFESLRK